MPKEFCVIENNHIKYLNNLHIYSDAASRLINKDIIGMASNILNTDIYFKTIELHAKWPKATETPPHQDNFYFCLNPPYALTMYIAVTENNASNGGLGVILGSHKHGLYDHESSKTPAFSSGIEEKDIKDEKYFYTLKPGDMAVHHCQLIHFK